MVGAFVCALLALVAVAAGRSSAAEPAGGSTCPHANSQPDEATTSQLRHAVLCVINQKRAEAGVELSPLKLNNDLTRMAKHHTKTMLAEDCLDHHCAGELPLAKRLKNSGYIDSATKWAYAEDLGYESTPKQMVNRWASTTLDAKNILSPIYGDVGIGPGRGAAEAGASDSGFETYTIDLGWRKLE
jgi:uncharacterized protein YkwD